MAWAGSCSMWRRLADGIGSPWSRVMPRGCGIRLSVQAPASPQLSWNVRLWVGLKGASGADFRPHGIWYNEPGLGWLEFLRLSGGSWQGGRHMNVGLAGDRRGWRVGRNQNHLALEIVLLGRTY